MESALRQVMLLPRGFFMIAGKTFRMLLVLAMLSPLIASATSLRFDVREFGAVGDGVTVNTVAIQKAIDQCSAEGGGVVLFAGGRFVTGTIYFKDNVTLRVEAGAVLLGSTNIADYATDTHKNLYKNEPHMDRCLIFGRGVSGIGIEGNGIIDGRGGVGRIGEPGHRAFFPNQGDAKRNRPMLLRLMDCSRIRVRDITLRNPAAWTSAWLYCRDIVVDGITLSSRVCNNGDGLDFDGCENVRVSNCAFDTSDDSICLQASRKDQPVRDVVINNCVFVSKWAGIRIGLLSSGDFENVTVSNCVFRDIDDSGLKIQMCEGGAMRNMTFANLVMQNVPRPIFMTFCQQRAGVDSPEGGYAPMNTMGGFVFDGLQIDSSRCGTNSAFIFTGMPGHPIRDIRLSNIQFTTGGGADASMAARRSLNEFTPEVLEGWWPEYRRLGGTVLAHGIYARHVEGLTLNNVVIKTAAPDLRPAVVCDDVSDLDLNGVAMQGHAGAESLVRLQDVREAVVRNCQVGGAIETFTLIEGKQSANVHVAQDNFARASRLCEQEHTGETPVPP